MPPKPPVPLTWPDPLPAHGPVRLRPFAARDLDLVAELAEDPYLPMIGTVPAVFTPAAGRAYLARQHRRLHDGLGWSFVVADRASDRAVGGAGRWLGSAGSATAGYAVAPPHRGRGYAVAALRALTDFAWTGPALDRVELLIEPGNAASVAVALRAGYAQAGLLPAHSMIGGVRRDMVRLVARAPGAGPAGAARRVRRPPAS